MIVAAHHRFVLRGREREGADIFGVDFLSFVRTYGPGGLVRTDGMVRS